MALKNDFFQFVLKSLGIIFVDPKPLSIVPSVLVPELFEVTFERFFPGAQNGQLRVQNGLVQVWDGLNWPKTAKNIEREKLKKQTNTGKNSNEKLHSGGKGP